MGVEKIVERKKERSKNISRFTFLDKRKKYDRIERNIIDEDDLPSLLAYQKGLNDAEYIDKSKLEEYKELIAEKIRYLYLYSDWSSYINEDEEFF
jgi:hypothetical protein